MEKASVGEPPRSPIPPHLGELGSWRAGAGPRVGLDPLLAGWREGTRATDGPHGRAGHSDFGGGSAWQHSTCRPRATAGCSVLPSRQSISDSRFLPACCHTLLLSIAPSSISCACSNSIVDGPHQRSANLDATSSRWHHALLPIIPDTYPDAEPGDPDHRWQSDGDVLNSFMIDDARNRRWRRGLGAGRIAASVRMSGACLAAGTGCALAAGFELGSH